MIVQANPDKQWNWYGISQSPNITMDLVQANPNKPWNWKGLSCNPNITLDIIYSNLDKSWDWAGLSSNTFAKNKQQFIERKTFQSFVRDNFKEPLVQHAFRPERIQLFLNAGVSIDDLDDIL